jgi:hypothetical protein
LYNINFLWPRKSNNTYVQTLMHTYIQAYIQTNICTYVSAYIQTHINLLSVAQQSNSSLSRLVFEVSRSHTHTHTHTHIRIPLNEWSACRRRHCLYGTQQTQATNIHALSRIRTRNPPIDRPQTYALERTATGLDLACINRRIKSNVLRCGLLVYFVVTRICTAAFTAAVFIGAPNIVLSLLLSLLSSFISLLFSLSVIEEYY